MKFIMLLVAFLCTAAIAVAGDVIPVNCYRTTDGVTAFQIKKGTYTAKELIDELPRIVGTNTCLRMTISKDCQVWDVFSVLLATKHSGIAAIEIVPPHNCPDDILARLPATNVTIRLVGWETKKTK